MIRGSKLDPWKVNEQVLRSQLKSGISRIDYVSGDIWETLATAPSDSYRAKEINWLLDNAGDYGYELVGNSWIKVVP